MKGRTHSVVVKQSSRLHFLVKPVKGAKGSDEDFDPKQDQSFADLHQLEPIVRTVLGRPDLEELQITVWLDLDESDVNFKSLRDLLTRLVKVEIEERRLARDQESIWETLRHQIKLASNQ